MRLADAVAEKIVEETDRLLKKKSKSADRGSNQGKP
jgi:hypothetical protein